MSTTDLPTTSTTNKLPIPTNWSKVPKIGNPIPDTPFIISKTPIDIPNNTYDVNTLTTPSVQYTLQQLIDYFNNNNKLKPLGLVINLCNDKNYYDSNILHKYNIKYASIPIDNNIIYNDMSYTQSITNLFNRIVNNYIDMKINDKTSTSTTTPTQQDLFTDHTMLVHDIYGYNSCGCCISSYLIDECNYTLTKSLNVISVSRPPGIYNRDTLINLQMRFGIKGEKLQLVKPPVWDKPINTTTTSTNKSTTISPNKQPIKKRWLNKPTTSNTNTDTSTKPNTTDSHNNTKRQKIGNNISDISNTHPPIQSKTTSTHPHTLPTITQQHPCLQSCDNDLTSTIINTIQQLSNNNIFNHLIYNTLTKQQQQPD